LNGSGSLETKWRCVPLTFYLSGDDGIAVDVVRVQDEPDEGDNRELKGDQILQCHL